MLVNTAQALKHLETYGQRQSQLFTVIEKYHQDGLEDLKSQFCFLKEATSRYSQIQEMAQRLDLYLNRYCAQYINCMISDSEFVAFVNHTIQLALDLTAYPNIWAVLLILLKTQDVNTSYVQVMQKDLKITCIILLLMEFQLTHSKKCAIYEFSQQINMMLMLRIAHKDCIMLILMTY